MFFFHAPETALGCSVLVAQFLQCSDIKRIRQLGMKDNPETSRYNIANLETRKLCSFI